MKNNKDQTQLSLTINNQVCSLKMKNLAVIILNKLLGLEQFLIRYSKNNQL